MAKRVSDLTARLDTEVDGTEFVLLSDTDAVYNTITAATISASTVDDSFNDSGNGLGIFRVGTTISVSGFATGSLNTTYTVASVASDGSKITVAETLTATESAGSSVTINGLGVSYKMLLSELAEYTGTAGLPASFSVDSINANVYNNGASGAFDYNNGEMQKCTLTIAGTVISFSNVPEGGMCTAIITDADTFAPNIGGLSPWGKAGVPTFNTVTIIHAFNGNGTVRYIAGEEWAS